MSGPGGGQADVATRADLERVERLVLSVLAKLEASASGGVAPGGPAPVDPAGEVMSYEEASAVLGCAEEHIRKLVRQGKLKRAKRVGRAGRVTAESVRLLLRGEPKPATRPSPRPRAKSMAEQSALARKLPL